MTSFSCRECGASLSATDQACPDCRCRAPFACSVCGRALSSVSLGTRCSQKNPHGAYSDAGAPLCHQHRLTRCHHCAELFPLLEMTRHEVGKHEDRVLRQGKPPRIEPVFGYYCAACQRGAPSPHVSTVSPRLYVWAIGVLIAMGGLVVGILTIQSR
jgi:hypothetical protein